MTKGKRIEVTPELKKFIKEQCSIDMPYKKQAEMAYELGLINEPYSARVFCAVCHRAGYKTNNCGCFPKGHVPYNKGRKQTEYCTPEAIERMKKTQFKKGEKNNYYRFRPVGSERITIDGYVEIKVAEPKTWMLKQRYLWEQYYNVKLGKDDLILFLDGDKTNLDISNLRLVTRKELAILNHDYGDIEDVSIRETALKIVKLRGVIYDKGKR